MYNKLCHLIAQMSSLRVEENERVEGFRGVYAQSDWFFFLKKLKRERDEIRNTS